MKFDEAIELLETNGELRAASLLRGLRAEKRTKMRRRAPSKSHKLTEVEKQEVYRLYKEGRLTVPEIAAMFNVNPGRVVEVADRFEHR